MCENIYSVDMDDSTSITAGAERNGLAELVRRVSPAEVARLVRVLESRFEGRETAQVPAQERKQ